MMAAATMMRVNHLAAIRDLKARTDVEDNCRKTIGQLLGGAAVLIGAGFAYLQFQQQTSSRDLLISNQVAIGFELLGNKDDKTSSGWAASMRSGRDEHVERVLPTGS
jgi:hypothetical protein